jgi:hypothetical protein
MAGNAAAASAGRMLGALAGPLLFREGLWANSALAAGLDFLALVILLIFIKQE